MAPAAARPSDVAPPSEAAQIEVDLRDGSGSEGSKGGVWSRSSGGSGSKANAGWGGMRAEGLEMVLDDGVERGADRLAPPVDGSGPERNGGMPGHQAFANIPRGVNESWLPHFPEAPSALRRRPDHGSPDGPALNAATADLLADWLVAADVLAGFYMTYDKSADADPSGSHDLVFNLFADGGRAVNVSPLFTCGQSSASAA